MKVERIQIAFENCEVANLNSDMLEFLAIEKITESKYIYKSFKFRNAKELENRIFKCCGHMLIDINPKGYEQRMKAQDMTLEERIEMFSDIVSIILIYEDNSEEEIFVKWNDESEVKNKYQKVDKTNDGDLRVEIGE